MTSPVFHRAPASDFETAVIAVIIIAIAALILLRPRGWR